SDPLNAAACRFAFSLTPMLADPTQAILNREHRGCHVPRQAADKSMRQCSNNNRSERDVRLAAIREQRLSQQQKVSRCPVRAFVSSIWRGGGLTRKRPDEIEGRHRLENGRSNGGTCRRSRQRPRTRTLHKVARRLDHVREPMRVFRRL